MVDESTEIIELEIRGTKYILEGSFKLIMKMVELIKFVDAWHKDKVLHAKGEHSLKDIIALSGGKNIAVVQLPGADVVYPDGITDVDRLLNRFEELGVQYCILPDLDPTDGFLPVAIPPQYADVVNAVIASYQKEKIHEGEKEVHDIDDKISKCRADIEKATTKEEKEEAEIRLENLVQAKAEKERHIDKLNQSIESGSVITYEDYLALGNGREFDKDPELALKKYGEGLGMDCQFKASEIFSPIRSADAIIGIDGKDKMSTYYKSPVSDIAIRRTFYKDEDGLLYSLYDFTAANGEKLSYTDKGMTANTFREQVLPQIYEKAGLLADSPVRPFATKEELKAFRDFDKEIVADSDKKVAAQSLENIKDAGAKEYAQKNIESAVKGRMYENAQNSVSIKVKMQDLTAENGAFALKTEQGVILVPSAKVINDKDELVLRFKKDETFTLVSPKKESKTISAAEVRDLYKKNASNVEGEAKSHTRIHGNRR